MTYGRRRLCWTPVWVFYQAHNIETVLRSSEIVSGTLHTFSNTKTGLLWRIEFKLRGAQHGQLNQNGAVEPQSSETKSLPPKGSGVVLEQLWGLARQGKPMGRWGHEGTWLLRSIAQIPARQASQTQPWTQ